MKNCFLYKHIIDKISLQHYLCIPKKYVKYITILRLSSHSLPMETGRYQGINKVNRLFQFCKSDVEDEFHFDFFAEPPIEGHAALDRNPGPGLDNLLQRLIPGYL